MIGLPPMMVPLAVMAFLAAAVVAAIHGAAGFVAIALIFALVAARDGRCA